MAPFIDQIRFGPDGLIPIVTQDAETGELLMRQRRRKVAQSIGRDRAANSGAKAKSLAMFSA